MRKKLAVGVTALIIVAFIAGMVAEEASEVTIWWVTLSERGSLNANFPGQSQSVDLKSEEEKPNVYIQVVRDGLEVAYITVHNIITNAGMNWTQYKLSHSTGGGTDGIAYYIAVSDNSPAVAYTDTTLASEQNADGLTRQVGTFTNGAASNGDVAWSVHYNYTYTGSSITINAAGLFTESSSGVLYAAAVFGTNATLTDGDKLNVQWDISATN